jgi:hypothetical protein
MTPRHYMAPDHISVCSTAVAEHMSGTIGWGATQQEHDGTQRHPSKGRRKGTFL